MIKVDYIENQKILVSDFDGTFYTDENSIRVNCCSIEQFIKEGNIFVLSSGRSLKSLTKKVNEYNIPYSYLSCSDGSFLFDNKGILHFASLISHDVVSIFSNLEKLNKHKRIDYTYVDDYSEKYDNKKLLGSIAFIIDEENINREYMIEFKKIREKHPEYQYDVYGYDGEYYFLIRPHGVSKSSPIEYLEELHRIPKENIFTIGDNTNDKELIRDYNGYRIGDNKDIIDVSLNKYGAVYELVSDIENKKALKRW